MTFSNTFDEFAKEYGFKDKEEVYTNGAELIPVFRVNQWLEHILKTRDMDIKALEQEPKTGHWKHNKCDVCGASRPPLLDNFCPNCGAKMESEE